MRTIRRVLPFVVVIILSFPSRAAIRPSFSLLYLPWHATDIVVVTEGDVVDGRVTVLETWAGGLKAGELITVPGLGAFASDASRTVSRFGFSKKGDKPPVIVSPERMVLFLKRVSTSAATDEQTRQSNWQPSSRFGGMKVSIAWITGDHTYAFTQVMNPGPSLLTSLGFSEAELKIEVDRTTGERDLLKRIAALGDAKAKARQAAKHIDSANFLARREAFAILGASGKDALPWLRRVLRDDSKQNLHPDAVKTLAVAGGEDVVPELTAIVEAELQFWQETAPGLKRGWWNGKGVDWNQVGDLRARYCLVLEVFYALRKLESPACRDAVTSFRDYWRSLPQLEDKSGLDQMSRACDAVLRALSEK